jgi:pimeloyl-ACP methyl ester carboxylesterase
VEAELTTAPRSLAVTADDGIALNLVEWHADGSPCLFLHGLGHHGRVWDDVIPFLPAGHRALALDHRGHGGSGWSTEGRYGIDVLVDDVQHVLDALALDRVVLIGHSLGGSVAIRVAAARGASIRGLVVVEAGPELKRPGLRRVVANEDDGSRTYGTIEEYIGVLMAKYPFARRDPLTSLARHELVPAADGTLVRRCDPAFGSRTKTRVDADDGARVVTDEALWGALARTSAPTLIVRGVASSVLSADAVRRMVEASPDARATTIKQAGHAVPLENPAALGAAIADFLSSLAATPSRTCAG